MKLNGRIAYRSENDFEIVLSPHCVFVFTLNKKKLGEGVEWLLSFESCPKRVL